MIKGFIDISYAFDAGSHVDSSRAKHAVVDARLTFFREIRHREQLRYGIATESIAITPRWKTTPVVVATIFCDFCGMGFRFRLPFEGTLNECIELSNLLSQNEPLRNKACELARETLQTLGDSVIEPQLSEELEDYLIFCFEPPTDQPLDAFIEEHKGPLAQIINSEMLPLHSQVVQDFAEHGTAWYADHMAFIDWPAAIIFGSASGKGKELLQQAEEALEYANTQLLQFSVLSRKIDSAIFRAYSISERSKVTNDEIMMLDSLSLYCAELFGRVGSGLKLFSHQHLANLHDLIYDQFEFEDRTSEVRLKLEDLRTIVSRIVDKNRHRDSQRVELLIAGLIIVELYPVFTNVFLWMQEALSFLIHGPTPN